MRYVGLQPAYAHSSPSAEIPCPAAFSCQVPGSSELQYHHVYTVHTMPLHFLSTQVQESCQSIHEELELLGKKK